MCAGLINLSVMTLVMYCLLAVQNQGFSK